MRKHVFTPKNRNTACNCLLTVAHCNYASLVLSRVFVSLSLHYHTRYFVYIVAYCISVARNLLVCAVCKMRCTVSKFLT